MVTKFFQSTEHQCGYFSDRVARNAVVDPNDPQLAAIFPTALANGFRRSGGLVYRPHCPACNACTASRIAVKNFKPNRSQRRCLRDNQELTTNWIPASFSEEAFQLYARYLSHRHPDAGMDHSTREDFSTFLISPWGGSYFLELRFQQTLIGVAVSDHTRNALSAMYTFYAPEQQQRGLGSLAILKQIEYAKQQSIDFVYLGYWIEDHPKMAYKENFQPLELLRANRWSAK